MDDPLAAHAARLAQALDEAPCGLLQTTEDGLILKANGTFCRWIGQAREDLQDRKRLQDLFTVGGRIFHQTHWAPLLRMQGSVSEVKLELAHRDGQTIPMVLNAIRCERGGRIVHEVAIYVARDRDTYERELVLSRRRLQEAVAEATRLQAETRDRASFAEQMIGIVSHDLRNPLSTVQTGALLLSRLSPTPQQQQVIERIQRAGERAARLIGDLLDFTAARLGGGIAVHPRTVALHAQVAEHVEELRLAFPGRRLLHDAQGEPGADEVHADADRVVQIIDNLVGNAVAYGQADQPVTVRSRVEADSFLVAVHNFGAPIPMELRERLFLPLSRGDSPVGSGRSVGLGLYIVDAIARAHGGRIDVQSTEAGGTTFTVVFPRRMGSRPLSDGSSG